MTDNELRKAIRVVRHNPVADVNGAYGWEVDTAEGVLAEAAWKLADYAEAKMGRTAENCDFGSACTRNVLVLRCDVPQTDAIKLACPCASWQPKEDTP